MKLQPDNYSCGVYSIINAASVLGCDIKKKDILKHSNTTKTNGTDEKGIINALKKLKFKVYEFHISFDAAIFCLKNLLHDGSPVIVYFDSEEHWCTMIGHIGDKFVLFDSNNKINNGVTVLSSRQLKKLWLKDGKCYGIAVSKK